MNNPYTLEKYMFSRVADLHDEANQHEAARAAQAQTLGRYNGNAIYLNWLAALLKALGWRPITPRG